MAEEEAVRLRQELEWTQEELAKSKRLNAVLEKFNHRLIKSQKTADAQTTVVESAFGDVRDIIRRFKRGLEPELEEEDDEVESFVYEPEIDIYEESNSPPSPVASTSLQLALPAPSSSMSTPESDRKKYKCPKCVYSTAFSNNLSKHIRLHDKPNYKPNRAIIAQRNGEWTSRTLPNKQHVAGPSTSKSQILKFKFPSTFKNLSKGTNGIRLHNSHSEPGPKRRGRAPGPMKPMFCDNCDRVFKYRSMLYAHRQECLGNRKSSSQKPTVSATPTHMHSCDYPGCHFATKYYHSLKIHISGVHQKLRPFVCSYDDCDAAFAYKQVLEDHVRRKHTGERPYSCKPCSKFFYNRTELSAHLKSKSHVQNEHGQQLAIAYY